MSNTLKATVTASELQCQRALLRSPAYVADGTGECPFPIMGGYPLASANAGMPSRWYVLETESVTSSIGMYWVAAIGSAVVGGGLDGCVYTSLNGGVTWRRIKDFGYMVGAHALAWGDYLYIGAQEYNTGPTQTGAIWRTADGYIWNQVYTTGGDELPNAFCVYDTYLYAGCVGGKIFRSNDGTTWNLVATLTGETVSAMVTFSNFPDFARIHVCAGSGGKIYESTDGTTFAVNTTIGGEIVGVMGSHPGSDAIGTSRLYAGSNAGNIYIRDQAAAGVWTLAGNCGEPSVAGIASYDGVMYVGTGSSGRLLAGATVDDLAVVEDFAVTVLTGPDVVNGYLYVTGGSENLVCRLTHITTGA